MTGKKRRNRAEDLEAALRDIVLAVRQVRIPYMLIGALALPVWGRPRATLDIDFMILAASSNGLTTRWTSGISAVGPAASALSKN
jgi:hypothetical protein